jgi:membrane protease YdiL (CAAX protease family)
MAAASSQVNKKLPIKNAIYILLLLVVGAVLFRAFHIGTKPGKSNSRSIALVECYRAEMLMRMADVFKFLPQSKFISQVNTNQNTQEQAIVQAQELLEKAVNEQPQDNIFLCKKIILKAEIGKSIESDLEKLDLLNKDSAEKNQLTQQQKLGRLISVVYSPERKEQTFDFAKDAPELLNQTLSDGWYGERALLKIYGLTHQTSEYRTLTTEVKQKTLYYVLKLMIVGILGAICALAGIVIILYQLIIGNEKRSDSKDDKPIIVQSTNGKNAVADWQTVTLVFLAWFFTQLAMAYLINMFKQKGLFISYETSLSSAISVVLIYLISNGPALLYIYFLALKPNGLKFKQGVSLYPTVGSRGIIALCLAGLMGWLAAMPIVLTAYFISANFFGSGGSSNPVIGIVVSAAQDSNFFAISLFYLALGVLAPICEESLFRGFFYSHLRIKRSALSSNIVSSALFSIAHFDPGAVLPLFCLGSVFAYLREKTGSILPSILAHGIWNSMSFTMILVLFGSS